MEKDDLDARLQQLHHDLQQVESLDPREREILQQLQQDIQTVLAHTDPQDLLPYTRLGEGLQEGITQWETSHPRLTFLMGQIAATLARMGI